MNFSEETREAVSKHAIAEYPKECCGIITGTDTIQNVHRLTNIQDRLHDADPELQPRTASTAYAVDHGEADAVLASAASRGEKILGFYHSHIDCDAYFSERDREAQTAFGEPEFPEAIQVVISVKRGRIDAIKEFVWDGTKSDFVQS